jgi:tartrate-resistant acid phosphatase type 5
MALGSINRRQFIQRSFAFSAAASLAGCGSGVRNDFDPVDGGVTHYLMVGDWGTSGTVTEQDAVAVAMQKYVAKYSISTDALLMLGDNMYGPLPGGSSCQRFEQQFENTYPQSAFNCPAFVVPGNHDYQVLPESKVDAEMNYAASTKTRWTQPGRYYTFKWPPNNPSVTFIALDSNMPNEPAQPIPPDPSFYTPTEADRYQQLQWLENTLAEPLNTPYRIVIGHHPLYSNGEHGDNHTLIGDWSNLFKQYNVNLYFAGHDHDLQHIEIPNHPTSWVSSGGGGQTLSPLRESAGVRGPFAQEVHGFTHLQVRPDMMIIRHLDHNGSLLHRFTKLADGTIAIQK